MTYSLYCSDEPTQSKKMPDICRVVPVDSDSMGTAIGAACQLISSSAPFQSGPMMSLPYRQRDVSLPVGNLLNLCPRGSRVSVQTP